MPGIKVNLWARFQRMGAGHIWSVKWKRTTTKKVPEGMSTEEVMWNSIQKTVKFKESTIINLDTSKNSGSQ